LIKSIKSLKKLNHWKKIQVFFSNPNDILGFMQTFKQKVYRNQITRENREKSRENLIKLEEIKDKTLIESKIYKEFVMPIHDFLIKAMKFHELIDILINKISNYPFEIETLIQKAKNNDNCSNFSNISNKFDIIDQNSNNNTKKPRLYQSHSPLKSPISYEKRSNTPDSLLWRFENNEISMKSPLKDGIIKEIIEKSFEKKLNKGHCFLYEDIDGELDNSWKELLNLRGEISKLLWEEERRVRKTREKVEKTEENQEIEYNWTKVLRNI